MGRLDVRGVSPRELFVLFSGAVKITSDELISRFKREIPSELFADSYSELMPKEPLETLSKRQLEELLFRLVEEKSALTVGIDMLDSEIEKRKAIESRIALVNQARRKFIYLIEIENG